MKKKSSKIILMSYILLGSMILSPLFAFASTANNTGLIPTSSTIANFPEGGGVYIIANNTTTIIDIVKVSASTADTANIYSATSESSVGSLLGTATFLGNVATFGTPISITSGSNYFIFVTGSGGSYMREFASRSGYTWPIVATDLNFVDNCYLNGSPLCFNTTGFGDFSDIAGIDTNSGMPPPPTPPLPAEYYAASSTCSTVGLSVPSGANYIQNSTTTCEGYLPLLGGTTSTAPYVNDISDKFNYKDQVLSFGIIVFLLMFPVLIWVGSIFKPRDKVIKFKK